MKQTKQSPPKHIVPGGLNLAIGLLSIAIALSMLWLASHTTVTLWFILAIIAFSYINNTIFSLFHEAVHGIFHPNWQVNEWAGRVLAAFFPTGLTFQRIAHLGHHRRNRTDAEVFDYYKPGENKAIKIVQWYGILTGIYWLLPPLSCLVFLLFPGLVRWGMAYSEKSKLAFETSAEGMLSGYEKANFTKIRLEILFSIILQLTIFFALDLSLVGWAACYAAFAFNWCSLQYTDHAFSELDVHDGAWNLKVNKVVQFIFLNYHHHRAHHQYPHIPWLYLHRYIRADEKRPSFIKLYLKMWLGPRPYPETASELPEPLPLTHDWLA